MQPSLIEILGRLLAADVELILVGGLAAVAQGAPVTTFDVDIVHRRTEENVDRLLGVLNQMDAHIREPTERQIPPSREALIGPGHTLLVTSLGPLDCLGAIEDGLDYSALLPDTLELDLDGQLLRVLSLRRLVELKAKWPDEESQLRAALLRRTLDA